MDDFKENEIFSETESQPDILRHYGIKRRSGRYPWGSGEDPYQRDGGDLVSRVNDLKNKGYSEREIAKELGILDPRTGQPSTGRLRAQLGVAESNRWNTLHTKAVDLRNKGYTLDQIAKEMGYANDSSVRSLLNVDTAARMSQAQKTANFLKEKVDTLGAVDVGAGVEKELCVSRERLNQALYILETEGYQVRGSRVEQVTNPGSKTTLKVLAPPDAPKDIAYKYEDVHSLSNYVSHDGGDTFDTLKPPASLDSKRIKIQYAEEGGLQKDGVVELRRNVPDISLGASQYAQVRILVDGTHYIKGMAVYADDLPDGVDVRFNTNKSMGTPMEKVLKPIKDDPLNPFGTNIKPGGQSYWVDEKGEKHLSVINKKSEEGDWDEWGDRLPSQFLSKQRQQLINSQLDLSIKNRQAELEEYNQLTNPVVKKKMLMDFAESCDKQAVQLYAAALPGQRYQVILPLTDISDKEVYAPNFKDGQQLALVRYPHGGTFEIPIVTVNNKNSEGRRVIGTNALDAIGINANVAARLSGADFDGDTVMCIPTNKDVRITSTPPLKGLEGFDSKMAYPERKGMKYMKDPKTGTDLTQKEMGMISNLITDMTIKNASQDEIAKAVRHSMVVIDAGKHKLNYMQSAEDNDIATLKSRYQGRYDEEGRYHEGASTLLSRAKSEVSVPKRQGSPQIADDGSVYYKTADDLYYPARSFNKKDNTVTMVLANGKRIKYGANDAAARAKYDPIKRINEDTGEIEFTNADGSIKYRTKMRTQRSTLMAETSDARLLSSGSPQEEAYANFANSLKALANQARKDYVNTKPIPQNKEARKAYDAEVRDLESQLNIALRNAPRERRAQLTATVEVKKKLENYESSHGVEMSKNDEKKLRQRELERARGQYGAKKVNIKISDRAWEAIQAGAISNAKMQQIIDNADMDSLRKRATPRQKVALTPAKVAKMKAMRNAGYTTAEIAESLGVSSSTVSAYITGKEK